MRRKEEFFTPLGNFSPVKRAGFTLVELLIVIVIITIMASIGVVRYGSVIERARAVKAQSTLSNVVKAENRYFLEEDIYTATLMYLDIYDSDPSDADVDFDYSFVNPWAIANRTSSGGGRMSYRLSLTGTRETSSPDGSFP